MPRTECRCCGGSYYWTWSDAFDKHGFDDGDGQVETGTVQAVLEEAGYAVDVTQWGIHNTVISSIRFNGEELMPLDNPDIAIGEDDPRSYLPEHITALLDDMLPDP